MATIIPDSQGAPAPAAADPVSMISALLDAERVTPDTPAVKQQPAVQPTETGQPETEPEYQPDDNAQPEGADAPADEGTSEKSPIAEIPLDQLEAIELEVTFKGADGKPITEKLPIKELREGYMKAKDYSAKTAEVAREKENVASAVRQGIETERTAYAGQLQQMKQALVEAALPEFKGVDWNALANENPAEYVRLQNRFNQLNTTFQSIEAKQRELAAKTEAEKRQADQTTARKSWATLESDIPGWNEDAYQKTMKAAIDVGFNPGEVSSWLDARLLKLANKALLYDQLKAGNPPAQKKVVVAPKVVKPGNSQPTTGKQQQSSRAFERLQKTGSVDALAALIATRM